MAVVKAEFDGKTFVPRERVDLPAGTPVEVFVPEPVGRPTAAEEAEWRDILREIASSEPPFSTVDVALDQTRGRP